MSQPPKKVVAIVGVVAATAVLAWLLFKPHSEKGPVFTGYVTVQNLYLSSPVAGTVSQVDVTRGQRVAAGAALFRIDPTSLDARADRAGAQIGQGEAQLAVQQADLGRARASLAAAQADADKAAADLSRLTAANAQKPGAVAQQQIDAAKAAAIAAARNRDGASAEAAAAQAGIAAAQAELRGSRAGLTDARRQVAQLAPTAPASATVEDVMYQAGEWAAPNTPVVSLAPDNQVKVRFYVPQGVVRAYGPGAMVAIGCDGCAAGMTAKVDYVAPRPEYTPPVIYSLTTRDKLVFLVEAIPSDPRALTIGQPIDVRPLDAEGVAAMSDAPANEPPNVIDVHGLNKSFGGRRVVKDVSIAVGQGKITGFLGPNGSGKTTTLRLLCGLLTPDSGEGQVLGMNFRTQSAAIKRQTGYMTQKFSLYDDMTIAENLTFVARVYGLADRRERVKAAVDRLGLTDRRDQLAGALSGGWKQRLALAAATLHEPKLLLLDEPTAGVDPKARREFWDEIHALAAEGLTVLVSTHYMDEAERCHDIGYILHGQLIARGTAQDIIAQSNLVIFNGEGPEIDKAAHALAKQPGVLSASAFGASVHVSGTDRAALEAAIKPYRKAPFRWRELANLEDVFIQLMGQDRDDRYAA